MRRVITRAGDLLARLCLALSALCLTALMCLTVAEVIGRYGFNAPIFGRQDIAQILLALAIFLAFPVATLRGEHISVDLLDSMFSRGAAFWRDRAIEALISVSLLTMGAWLFDRAEKALSRGNSTELLFLPKYPLLGFVAIVVTVTGCFVAVRTVMTLLRKKPA
jgi:TRAP-type C4-dicarboxylate transport system permease small subunit